MRIEPIALIGAGGHGRVVYDAIVEAMTTSPVVVYDDRIELAGRSFLDTHVIAPVPSLASLPVRVHVAIGANAARRIIGNRMLAAGKELVAVTHPRALISSRASMGAGTFVAAGAVIGPAGRIGKGTIVNHSAVVDHDCEIGEWVHIAPNATLGGTVRVHSGAFIGAGAVVLPGIEIGQDAVVGAGAVVIRPVEAGGVVGGNPARALHRE